MKNNSDVPPGKRRKLDKSEKKLQVVPENGPVDTREYMVNVMLHFLHFF